MTQKDYKILWPGDKAPQDTSIKTIRISNVAFSAIFFGLLFGFLSGLLIWNNFPNFPLSKPEVGSIWYIQRVIPFTVNLFSAGFDNSLSSQLYKAIINNPQFLKWTMFLRYVLNMVFLIGGLWYGAVKAWNPQGSKKHLKGRVLLRGKEALKDIKFQFNGFCATKSNDSGFIVNSSIPFDPTDQDQYEEVKDNFKLVTKLPEHLRTLHRIVVGGTGRGKSQLILWSLVSQCYSIIRNKRITFDRIIELENRIEKINAQDKIYEEKEKLRNSIKENPEQKELAKKLDNDLKKIQNERGKIEKYENEIEKLKADNPSENNRKLLICDTPKGDYSGLFRRDEMFIINPVLKGSDVWDIARDLNNQELAKEFWNGVIPASKGGDQTWSNSAVQVCTGITKTLQIIAPNAWDLGMVCYMFAKNPKDYEKIFGMYYPEAINVVNGADETVASVMLNLAAYTSSFNTLARIYDEFDTKKIICCATTKALSNSAYFKFWTSEIEINSQIYCSNFVNEAGKTKTHLNGSVLVNTLSTFLMRKKGEWTWKEFKEYIITNQSQILYELIKNKDDMFSKQCFASIMTYCDKWDLAEKRTRISIREWIVSDNIRDKKILVLQPYEGAKELTTGLIKGILYFSKKIILGDLLDNDNLPENEKNKLHILIDEFSSYGNISEFVKSGFEMFRSKGADLTIALQDFAQIEEIYSKSFLDFCISNAGQLIILGVNAGDTNKKLSDILGKMTTQTLQKTLGVGKDGQGSQSLQEKEEEIVSPADFNMLGADTKLKKIKYLYIGSKLNNVYELECPLQSYGKYDLYGLYGIIDYIKGATTILNTPDFDLLVDKSKIQQAGIKYNQELEAERKKKEQSYNQIGLSNANQ